MSDLLPVAEAQARLLGGLATLAGETVPLAQAAGRRAAGDVVSLLTQPPFAASAMDGYAIRWADRAGPWQVTGEAAAGRRFAGTLGAGVAVRIFTGAPVPDGADTVVVQEDVARDGVALRLTGDGPPRQGAHIRVRGLDFAAGEGLVVAGERLTPARLGLAAAAGHATLPVVRRPRVVILATGDELVPPGTRPGPDAIVSSVAAMLVPTFAAAGADARDGGIVPDQREALAAAVQAAAGADLLVTVGGASVGDHDLVRPVLGDLGATIDFWKIAMRPGKPMLSGALGDLRIVGLPGNPVSAFVCATLFVLPMLRRWSGEPAPLPRLFAARLAAPLAANDRRQDYLRAALADGLVTPAGRQDSSMVRTLAASNVLIVRQPFAPAAQAGDSVDCIALDFAPDVP